MEGDFLIDYLLLMVLTDDAYFSLCDTRMRRGQHQYDPVIKNHYQKCERVNNEDEDLHM